MRDLIDMFNRIWIGPTLPEPPASGPLVRPYPVAGDEWPRPNPMPLSYRSGHRGATITDEGITLD